jgi:hypothetical protein
VRSLVVLLVASMAAACAAPAYRLNIPRRADVASMVYAASAEAERDPPPAAMEPGARFDALALQELAGVSAAGLLPARPAELSERRAALADRVRREIVALAWPTTHAGAFAVHEVTVGTVDLPFADFLVRFSPAADWGKNLSGYLGGELEVDDRDADGRPIEQRERMVLASPIGAPDVDVAKYERIQHGIDEVRIRWCVTFSENGSSPLDEGYVLFRRYPGEDRERTLVAFNSIHRINTTWVAALLPQAQRQSAVLDSLRETFRKHIERYREVVSARRPR